MTPPAPAPQVNPLFYVEGGPQLTMGSLWPVALLCAMTLAFLLVVGLSHLRASRRVGAVERTLSLRPRDLLSPLQLSPLLPPLERAHPRIAGGAMPTRGLYILGGCGQARLAALLTSILEARRWPILCCIASPGALASALSATGPVDEERAAQLLVVPALRPDAGDLTRILSAPREAPVQLVVMEKGLLPPGSLPALEALSARFSAPLLVVDEGPSAAMEGLVPWPQDGDRGDA